MILFGCMEQQLEIVIQVSLRADIFRVYWHVKNTKAWEKTQSQIRVGVTQNV
jgi:hypothetical protein